MVNAFNPTTPTPNKEASVSDHVYKHLELTGSSPRSMEDAVAQAISRASSSVRNIRWFEVLETRGHIEDDKIGHWQVVIKIGFTVED
tara:strand:- start:9537 stop:9797 length:261 start_codon:yes stop_codon:yes gene_type:complete